LNDPTFFLLYCILQLGEKVLHDDDDHDDHGDHGDHGDRGDRGDRCDHYGDQFYHDDHDFRLYEQHHQIYILGIFSIILMV